MTATQKIAEGNKTYEVLLHKDLEILRVENRELSAVLRTEMREQKVDTIKWMVGLFFTLALMIIGLYLKR